MGTVHHVINFGLATCGGGADGCGRRCPRRRPTGRPASGFARLDRIPLLTTNVFRSKIISRRLVLQSARPTDRPTAHAPVRVDVTVAAPLRPQAQRRAPRDGLRWGRRSHPSLQTQTQKLFLKPPTLMTYMWGFLR